MLAPTSSLEYMILLLLSAIAGHVQNATLDVNLLALERMTLNVEYHQELG